MAKIPFTVSARTARLIGRENVSNADGAIIELVKNGHDADAENVHLLFCDDELFIVDNGHGMTREAIERAWMIIGTDNKETAPFSPNKRVKTGAKGIGRFALDRLGSKVEMYTLPKGASTGYHWEIDWSNFEKPGAAVDEITAELVEVTGLKLSSKLPTIEQKKSSEKITFPNGGTIIKISSLRDTWSQKAIAELYQNLESLVPTMDGFSITVLSSAFPEDFGTVQPLINDDFDYRIVATYNNTKKSIEATLTRNEFDLPALEKKYGKVFDTPPMTKFPYTLKTFKQGSYVQTYPIQEVLKGFKDPDGLLQGIGDFSFTFTYAKNGKPKPKDIKKYPYKNADYSKRREWLANFGGIKIFRDNFRVRPYGEKGDDWLQLGERQAQSPAGPGQRLGSFRVRPNQVSGSVHISRLSNIAFQDKSSREGIQENDTFDLFKEMLLGVISLLEKDRNTVFYALSQLYDKNNPREGIKTEASAIATRINDEKQSNTDTMSPNDQEKETLAAGVKALEDDIEERDEEIKILRNLASAGLITAAVAHELRGLENILTTRNRDLRSLIEPFINEEDLKDIKDARNPYRLLTQMEQTDIKLRDWLNYALMPLRRDKRIRKTFYLNSYFKGLETTWENLLSERLITLTADNVNEAYKVKLFSIDLDTIFNNLIINSIEAFNRKKERIQRNISISCKYDAGQYRITYSDNGAGLDESFQKDPDEIFQPQKTSKRDNSGNVIGTGMGMYLVKSVVEENQGSVELVPVKEGFSLAITLPGVE